MEAARLCALATSGQLLVTEMTRMMAGSRSGERFEPIGLVDLKGLPEPVAVCEVRWEPVADGTEGAGGSPLPSALADTAGFPFAGRARERATVIEAWEAARTGAARTVFIAGEPGIGKTRLVAEVSRQASGDGAIVLLGRSEDEIDAPFRPFAEVLDQMVRHASDEVLAEHVAEMGGAMVSIAPALGRRTGAEADSGGDADSERLRLFNSVADLVKRRAAQAPVLLVLDDLHWADQASLLLLRHLVQTVEDAPLLILVTYRDTDLDRHHPLANMLADFRRVPRVERVALTGLNQAEVIEYLALAGGHDLEPEGVELGRQLAEITDGNPFFVGETLRHLAESGAIAQRDGRWVRGDLPADRVGVPEGVREVVGRRLSALDDDTEALLTIAAVAGAQFDSVVVGTVADLDEDRVVQGLDVACRRALVVEDADRFGWYRFAHALVRQTLLEELSTTRRIRLHRAIGEQVERRSPDRLEEIANHYLEAAAAGTAAKAVEFAARAGDQANDRLAFERAMVWYERALEAEETLDPDPLRRCRLLLALGRADARYAGEHHHGPSQLEAADLARTIGRPDLLAQAAYQYLGPWGFWVEMADPHRRSLVEEALRALPPGQHQRWRMLLLTKLATEHSFDPDGAERHALSAEAASIARTLEEPVDRWDGLSWHAFTLTGSPFYEELAAVADEVDALAPSLDLVRRADTAAMRSHVPRARGDLAGSVRTMDRARALLAPVGVHNTGVFLVEPAATAMAQGRFDEAHELLDHLRSISSTSGDRLAAIGIDAWIYRWSDDPDGYRRAMTTAPSESSAFLSLFGIEMGEAVIRHDEAAARTALEAWRPLLAYVPGFMAGQFACTTAYSSWWLEDRESAEILLQLLRPHAGYWAGGLNFASSPADLSIGMMLLTLGRPGEAEPHLRLAVASAARAPAQAWEAFGRQFLALALLGVGRRDEAQAEAHRCRAQAAALGMHRLGRDLDRAGLVATDASMS
ncbi:AAA family ATPase [Aquihabitans daechungensis]|uniref:ATP-binding protein n=1 Tax=Aquihabitans daechungensis TaxID=1052257 RepID=UPI003BA1E192